MASDPADPIPVLIPAEHLTSRWAQGRATPTYLFPIIGMVVIATLLAAGFFVIRARTMSVLVVPAESALVDVSTRNLPDDGVLKDFMAFMIAGTEGWTPDTVYEISDSMNDFVHPTYRDRFRRHLKRVASEIRSIPYEQTTNPLVIRVAEKFDGSAILEAACQVHTLIVTGTESRLSHSEIHIIRAEIVADVATDRNRAGLLIRSWINQAEDQWTQAKRPKFWEDEITRRRNAQVNRIFNAKETSP